MGGSLSRIKQYIDYKGIVISQFEKTVGISNGAFASQLKKSKTIGVDKLENILNTYPELNPTWVLTGVGEMLKKEEGKKNIEYKHHRIPLYDSVTTTKNIDILPKNAAFYEPIDFVNVGDWFPDADAAMRVHGDSMQPDYHNGSIITLKLLKDKELIAYGSDYMIETEDYCLLRRVLKGSRSNAILACSTNTKRMEDDSEKGRLVYQPFEIGKDKIKRLFLVIGCVWYNQNSRMVVYNNAPKK